MNGLCRQEDRAMLSVEICVVQDLLQNHKELFYILDEHFEHEQKLLVEQRKLQNMVSVEKVIGLMFF